MSVLTTPQPLIESEFQHREKHHITCDICPHHCELDEGGIGICGGRQVINDKLVAINYAQISSLQMEPIEKKPLYHFFPGSDILSVGPIGCNLKCAWCVNWDFNHQPHPTRTVLPHELADIVDALDGIGVAYTYAEPLIWFEYIRDAGRIFNDRGLVNVIISNGYANPEPLKELLKVVDAFNIDLKALNDYTYRHFCGGNLQDVQRNIKIIYDAGKHIELTHLLVTGLNDDLSKVESVIDWIAKLDPTIPLHLSRYFPAHNYDEPPTDINFVSQAFDLAKSRLKHVYLGNLEFNREQHSYCPNCNELVVSRVGYNVDPVGLDDNKCAYCKSALNFIVN